MVEKYTEQDMIKFAFDNYYQEDNKDKKYTEEDLMSAFNEGQSLNVRGKLIKGKEWFNSLNKQD